MKFQTNKARFPNGYTTIGLLGKLFVVQCLQRVFDAIKFGKTAESWAKCNFVFLWKEEIFELLAFPDVGAVSVMTQFY